MCQDPKANLSEGRSTMLGKQPQAEVLGREPRSCAALDSKDVQFSAGLSRSFGRLS